MLRPRTALLFFLLLVVSTAVGFAGSPLAAAIKGSAREPFTLILLGAVLIVAAMGLRQVTRRRNLAR